MQELWTAFNDTQTQIEIIRTKDDEQWKRITQEEKGERIVFEDCYYQALDITCSIITATRECFTTSREYFAVQKNKAQPTTGNIVKLPTLKLPIFAGEYEQWMLFKDAFTSLIHDNSKLSNEKFQYLCSILKDEALQAISRLTTSAESYIAAWNLQKR